MTSTTAGDSPATYLTEVPFDERTTGWVVRCEDGQRRHRAMFATRAAAEKWAEWGHLCAARHTFHEHETGLARLDAEVTAGWARLGVSPPVEVGS